MKRWIAFLAVIGLLLGAAGLMAAAQEPISVSASYRDGTLTLSFAETEGFALTGVTVNGKAYSAVGAEGGASVSLLLTQSASGVCTFSGGGDEPETVDCSFTVPVSLSLSAVYDAASNQLSGTWQSDQFSSLPVTAVRVDKKTNCSVSVGEGNTFSAALPSLAAGTHSYTFTVSAGGETGTVSGGTFSCGGGSTTLSTSMKVSESSPGVFSVSLKDETNQPVAYAPVKMSLSGTTILESETDGNGQASFYYTCPDEQKAQLLWGFAGGKEGSITYLGCSCTLRKIKTTATTTVTTTTGMTTVTASTISSPTYATTTYGTTTGTTTTGETTTTTTTRLYTGATTTGHYDTGVIVNSLYDASILDTFGIREDNFSENARLLMEQDTYDTLSRMAMPPLMLTVFSSDDKLADTILKNALKKSEEYGFYKQEDAQSFALTLGVASLQADGSYVPVDPAMLPKDTYTVYLPVPDKFRNSDLAVISLEDDKAKLIEAIVNNGSVAFEVSAFGTYAVVAFPAATRTLNIPTLSIALFVLSGLFLVAAGFLLFWFVIRKPRPLPEEAVEEAPEGSVLLTFDDTGFDPVDPMAPDSGEGDE